MASGPQLLFPKLIVFGASGPTGLEVVQQNLAKGHAVTALVRTRKVSLLSKWILTYLC